MKNYTAEEWSKLTNHQKREAQRYYVEDVHETKMDNLRKSPSYRKGVTFFNEQEEINNIFKGEEDERSCGVLKQRVSICGARMFVSMENQK